MSDERPAETAKVTLRNYAWGLGGVADNLLTFGLAWTIVPIFNIGYGVDAFWLGIAIFIPRLLDVVTDPLMGVISDRTRSKFGRRRPYILFGAIAMAMLFALLWLPPFGAVTGSPTDDGLPSGTELYLILWVGIVYACVTLAYTIFSVPYIALGYEFTRNYDEMTKVMASRLYFTTLAGFGVTWVYRLAVDDRFGGDETIGMRYIGALVAFFVLITGIAPALLCRERVTTRVAQPKISIAELTRATIGNRAFIIVMTAMLVFVISLYTTGTLLAHINIFYVAQGDKELGGELAAISGNIMAVCTLIGMYPMMKLSQRLSKRAVALLAFTLALVGYLSLWWTWTPRTPQLQYASAVFIGFGSSGIWLMLDSMIGDVAKDDEARNGSPREGLFGAAKSFMFKLAVAAASLGGAFALGISGFEERVEPTQDVQLNLRLIYIGLQALGVIVAMTAVAMFPITRRQAAENEAIIEERDRRRTSSTTRDPA